MFMFMHATTVSFDLFGEKTGIIEFSFFRVGIFLLVCVDELVTILGYMHVYGMLLIKRSLTLL